MKGSSGCPFRWTAIPGIYSGKIKSEISYDMNLHLLLLKKSKVLRFADYRLIRGSRIPFGVTPQSASRAKILTQPHTFVDGLSCTIELFLHLQVSNLPD